MPRKFLIAILFAVTGFTGIIADANSVYAGEHQNTSRPFSFRCYTTEGLKVFAQKHFPVGTPKLLIDSVLVKQGHAKAYRFNDHPAPHLYMVTYKYRLGGQYDCDKGLLFVFNRYDETVYQFGVTKDRSIAYDTVGISGGCSNAP